uniref:Hexosyltransferase n=1 Tax=Sparus aurata TaxID=8175 RepID=A0A671UQA8_SPAAU
MLHRQRSEYQQTVHHPWPSAPLFWHPSLLLLLGTVGLFIFFSLHYNPEDVFSVRYVRKDDGHKMPSTKNSSYVYSWPRCQQNMSAIYITGFSSLPAEKSAEVFLLLVIKSSPVNYDRREVLRKTWAKERLHNGVWIRRIFISGTMDSGFEKERVNKLLELEQSEYNDILQWDFSDTFYNLTLKQILFLGWMERNCLSTSFLLFGDDDIFANTDNIVEYLQNLKDNNGNKHLFTGRLRQDTGPIRSPRSKYFIPVQVYKSESYPPYCGGGGYLLSGYTASVIYSMSQSVDIIPIDDAYMAMCLAKAGLGPVSHKGIDIDKYDPCFYKYILVAHRFLPAQIDLMWHKLHDPNLQCGLMKWIISLLVLYT